MMRCANLNIKNVIGLINYLKIQKEEIVKIEKNNWGLCNLRLSSD